MIRAIVTIVLTCLVPTIAIAQACSSYPYNLTNGTTADASQVMANFNHVLNCTNNNQVVPSLLRGWLGGLTMKNNDTTPNTVIDTAVGVANSDDASTLMTLTAFTKNADAAWAVGTGNGCLQSPATSLVMNTWYHLFVIARTDTGVVDQFCVPVANPTVINLPTNYTKQRRIGSFKTNGSAQIIAFVQNGDTFLWKAPVQDFGGSNPGTAATLRPLTVPKDYRVKALMTVAIAIGTTGTTMYLSSPDQTDVAPGSTARTLLQTQVNNGQSNGQVSSWTNLTQEVRTRFSASDANVGLSIVTSGWEDPRGRFD